MNIFRKKWKHTCVVLSVACLLFSIVFTGSAIAWDNHYRLTENILKSIPSLDNYGDIVVTPMTYTIEQIHETYVFPFKEGTPGSITKVKDILTTYCDEPDWGMDQNLNLSWQQKFMGGYEGVGSQGYIHCYYPAGSFNLPVIAMPMGMTPKRLEQITSLVKEAIAKGDLYWAFRFSAWAVHYLEDMGMPYHTAQTTKLFYWLKDGPGNIISGTTTVTGNYHFAYEAFSDYSLEQEMKGNASWGLSQSLLGNSIYESMEAGCLCKKVARLSHKNAKRAYASSRTFFGDKFFTSTDIEATVEDYVKPGPGNSKEELLSTIRMGFSLAGKAVRSYMAMVDEFIASNDVHRSELFKTLYSNQ